MSAWDCIPIIAFFIGLPVGHFIALAIIERMEKRDNESEWRKK